MSEHLSAQSRVSEFLVGRLFWAFQPRMLTVKLDMQDILDRGVAPVVMRLRSDLHVLAT